jgi:hypothetical protein
MITGDAAKLDIRGKKKIQTPIILQGRIYEV